MVVRFRLPGLYSGACDLLADDRSTGDRFVTDDRMKLGSRLLIGSIAGFVGTMAMTAAMRRLYRRLPAEERYPLTPREIVDSAAGQAKAELPSEAAKDLTTAAHFAYGALMGAMIAAMNPKPSRPTGAAAGFAIWLASYMGWIPAVGTLEPATRHPRRRNALMIAVHGIWGWWTAAALQELGAARETIFGEGPDKDAPRKPPRRAKRGRG
jgi:uncharacterized membrane protein YagU involved in acid resistance